ncbi:MAG: thiamine pyrophosphate-dependent enzyme [Verrucomicrobiota bacterium]|nr:thiamine pyrophosphate-dependent enzyme [Verrucomicrobiota bacterium]
MSSYSEAAVKAQQDRNDELIAGSKFMRQSITSQVLPLSIDIARTDTLDEKQIATLQALEIEAARISISSLASLATIGELDHLGGGLDLIPSLMLTLAATDYEKVQYTIENAHASIGYYSSLAALAFLDRDSVVQKFRRGLDIPGHVSWVPGGTQLNGGRLGVMIPVAAGQAMGMRARDPQSWVICHCGDAGWIAGQALNGFNAADIGNLPLTFVMQRNGIQLSDSNKNVMDKDPRQIVEAMGVEVIELNALFDTAEMYKAYKHAHSRAMEGQPTIIYPTGYASSDGEKVDFNWLANRFCIGTEVEAMTSKNGISMDQEIWVPGSLMSYRDIVPMLECVLLVNDLPGGVDHHDGHMKGRDEAEVLGNVMLTPNEAQQAAFKEISGANKVEVITNARPAPGTTNLTLSTEQLAEVSLPEVGEKTSARAGSEAGYTAVAKAHPNDTFIVSCDLNPSTKLGKAAAQIPAQNQIELSIEEQAALLVADGLAMSSYKPQVNVVSTFSAFFEGIAREGLELWRYQRNLNGINEGLNVIMHMSHVGACTGRDHFSGWSLDWVTLAIGYLPYVDRFYAPADARGAFVAIRDACARYGAHIVAIPRDSLLVLSDENGDALYNADSEWEAVTPLRKHDAAKTAILALGATAGIAQDAAKQLGGVADVYVVNGLPLPDDFLGAIFAQYDAVVTVEDGIIGTRSTGVRGFAGLVLSAASRNGSKTEHVGIVDPRIAPSEGHEEVWEHFGLTSSAIANAVKSLS